MKSSRLRALGVYMIKNEKSSQRNGVKNAD
jgi:hypothetical protein